MMFMTCRVHPGCDCLFPNHSSLTSIDNVIRSRKDVKENLQGLMQSKERIQIHLHQATADVTNMSQLWRNYDVMKMDCLTLRYFLPLLLPECFTQAI